MPWPVLLKALGMRLELATPLLSVSTKEVAVLAPLFEALVRLVAAVANYLTIPPSGVVKSLRWYALAAAALSAAGIQIERQLVVLWTAQGA
jgi:hypothetical protein